MTSNKNSENSKYFFSTVIQQKDSILNWVFETQSWNYKFLMLKSL